MLSPWLVLPMAVITMLVIAWHVVSLQHARIPASRKRIRTANGLLMLFVTALLAFALSIMNSATPHGVGVEQVRLFVLVWALIMGLLPIVIGLAILDALNNIRILNATRRRLKRQLGSETLREIIERTRASHAERSARSSSGLEPGAHRDPGNAG